MHLDAPGLAANTFWTVTFWSSHVQQRIQSVTNGSAYGSGWVSDSYSSFMHIYAYIYIYIMLFEMPLGDCALIVIPAGAQSPFCSRLCVYIRNRLAVHFKQFL